MHRHACLFPVYNIPGQTWAHNLKGWGLYLHEQGANQLAVSQGLPSGMETWRFAEDLLAKIPRAGAAPGRATLQYQQRERDAAAFVRKNAAFAMLEDDEDDFDEPPPAPTTAPVPKVAKKSLRKSKVCYSRTLYGMCADLSSALAWLLV